MQKELSILQKVRIAKGVVLAGKAYSAFNGDYEKTKKYLIGLTGSTEVIKLLDKAIEIHNNKIKKDEKDGQNISS